MIPSIIHSSRHSQPSSYVLIPFAYLHIISTSLQPSTPSSLEMLITDDYWFFVFLFAYQVIDNLRIERIEVRAEDDPDIAPYVHEKQIEFIKCEKGGDTLTDTARKVTWFSFFLLSLVIPMLYTVHLLSHPCSLPYSKCYPYPFLILLSNISNATSFDCSLNIYWLRSSFWIITHVVVSATLFFILWFVMHVLYSVYFINFHHDCRNWMSWWHQQSTVCTMPRYWAAPTQPP